MKPHQFHPYRSNTFGMLINERVFSASAYRYGFNGKEKDDEIKGAGNSVDFGARIYDGRLGRWLSVDPKFNHPINISMTPYSFSANSPTIATDEEGEIWHIVIGAVVGGGAATVKLAISGELKIKDGAWKKTFSQIGLGIATGATIATFPASGIGALAAGGTAFTANVAGQSINKALAGKSVTNLENYDYKSAIMDGVVTAITFGVGSHLATTWRHNVIGKAWAPKRFKALGLLSRQIYDHPQLAGYLVSTGIDLVRAGVEGLIEKQNKYDDAIDLPPVTIKYSKKSNDFKVDSKSLEDSIKVGESKRNTITPEESEDFITNE